MTTGGGDGWAVDYDDQWPPVVGRLLLVDQARGTLLAVITPPSGLTQDETIDRLQALDRLFAMLPAGAHPIPVN